MVLSKKTANTKFGISDMDKTLVFEHWKKSTFIA